MTAPERSRSLRAFDDLIDDALSSAAVTDAHYRVLAAVQRLNRRTDSPTVREIATASAKPLRTVYVAIGILAAHGYLEVDRDANGRYLRIEAPGWRPVNLGKPVKAPPAARIAHGAAQPAPPAARIAPPRALPTCAGASNPRDLHVHGNTDPPVPPKRSEGPALDRDQLEQDARRGSVVARLTLTVLKQQAAAGVAEPEPKLTPQVQTLSPLAPSSAATPAGLPTAEGARQYAIDELLARFRGRPRAEAARSIAESLGVRLGDPKPATVDFWTRALAELPLDEIRQGLDATLSPRVRKKARFLSTAFSEAFKRAGRAKKPASGALAKVPPEAGQTRRRHPWSNGTGSGRPVGTIVHGGNLRDN